jgi:hypothetical protein
MLQWTFHTQNTDPQQETSKKLQSTVRRGADKPLAFPIFLFVAQPEEFFLDGLKKLVQRSHKRVKLRGDM